MQIIEKTFMFDEEMGRSCGVKGVGNKLEAVIVFVIRKSNLRFID